MKSFADELTAVAQTVLAWLWIIVLAGLLVHRLIRLSGAI